MGLWLFLYVILLINVLGNAYKVKEQIYEHLNIKTKKERRIEKEDKNE